MKKILLAYLVVLFNLDGNAQNEDALVKNYRVDFGIPEHPAFNILDNNPDNILRPGDSKELFSIIYSNFLNGTTFLIPEEFSMEFSPVQLIGINKISLEKYQKNNLNRILNDAKFSVGTKTDSANSLNNLAVGIRLTWVDRKALVNNSEFLQKAYSYLYKKNDARRTFEDSLRKNHIKVNEIEVTSENLAGDDNFKATIDSLFERTYRKELSELRGKYKRINWNKFKFETSFAVKYKSLDSLVRNSHYSKFEMYNTIAVPFGNCNDNSNPGWGQGLIGVNIFDERFDSIKTTFIDSLTPPLVDTITFHTTNISIATRLYAGSNSFKAFIETGYKVAFKNSNKISLNIGSEINISDGFWGVISIGNEWSKSLDKNIAVREWTDNWYFNIDLRFHLPEKWKM